MRKAVQLVLQRTEIEKSWSEIVVDQLLQGDRHEENV